MSCRVATLLLSVFVASLVFAGDAPALTALSPDALREQQQTDSAALFVLDVRTPEEFAAGHVPGAVNIPHDQVAARLGEVPKDKEVVVYCRTGRRASLAAEVLAANGYTRLAHLEGDMVGWEARGLPVERPGPTTAPAK